MATTAESILALAQDPPKDHQERKRLYDAARQLMLAVELPHDTQDRLYNAALPMLFTQVGVDLKLFRILAAEPAKVWSVEELREKTGAEDGALLHRLLRHMTTFGAVRELGEGTYSAFGDITATLADPGTEGGLKHNIVSALPCHIAEPAFLKKTQYRTPPDARHCAFNQAYHTDQTPFEHLAAFPEAAQAAAMQMVSSQAFQISWMQQPAVMPLSDLQLTSADVEAGRPLMVDVGGGLGHQCLLLREEHPELKGILILQDEQSMLRHIPPPMAAKLSERNVEVMPHDFFSLQPSPAQRAKAYYLRNILHDWSDEVCLTILSHLKAALAPDSLIVIDDAVVPASGASGKLMNFDMNMLAMGSMERSEQQWRSLLERGAGLRVREIRCYAEEKRDSLIIVDSGTEEAKL